MQGSKSSTGNGEAMQQLQSLAGQQQGFERQTMGICRARDSRAPMGAEAGPNGDAPLACPAEQQAIRRQASTKPCRKGGRGREAARHMGGRSYYH